MLLHWDYYDCTPEDTDGRYTGLRYKIVGTYKDDNYGDEFTKIVATTTDGGADAKRDATLMAAAPDLRKACERALPWIGKLIAEGVHEKAIMPNDAIRTMEMLTAALAKAEGRTE